MVGLYLAAFLVQEEVRDYPMERLQVAVLPSCYLEDDRVVGRLCQEEDPWAFQHQLRASLFPFHHLRTY